MKIRILCLCICVSVCSFAQTTVTIDANKDNRIISPYLYGKNGVIEKLATLDNDLSLASEAGLHFTRQNSGNNATKYNWRKRITSHPDWYNNVYSVENNWDTVAQLLAVRAPEMQGMFAFSLLGRVASTNKYNFDEWAYNQANYWEGCSKNLCGGGTFQQQSDGSYTFTNGDYTLYTQEWPVDSVVAVLPHFENDLQVDLNQFQYWSMDNEWEIWGGTHDDVIPYMNDDTYEMMMQNYFATVKAARKLNPNIKICGPVAASEWTWFNTAGSLPTYNGKTYCWLEYFIMRCALEEKASGVKMIDVFDIHNYPSDVDAYDILQTHRLYWDTTYKYPKANGVKRIYVSQGNSWTDSVQIEKIFVRCQNWIDTYFGKDYKVSYAVSEYNVNDVDENNAMITALSYASNLGEGAKHGMEYFTPWSWKYGMWETVHLFSRYAFNTNVSSISSNEEKISAYTSINDARDAMTIILVNRATITKNLSLSIANFPCEDGTVQALRLSNLPDTVETFKSHTDNALQKVSLTIKDNAIKTTLPAYSITAILLGNQSEETAVQQVETSHVVIFPSPVYDELHIASNEIIKSFSVFDTKGIKVLARNEVNENSISVATKNLAQGVYVVIVETDKGKTKQTVIVE